MTSTCHGCGTQLPPNKGPGTPRKWCSSRCRKQTLYAGACVDCGAPTNGYNGPGKASLRCQTCDHAHRLVPEFRLAAVKNGAKATWTDSDIIAALRFVATEDGWCTHKMYLGAYDKAAPGEMPSAPTILHRFDKWSLALKAAGLRGGSPHKTRERLSGESCLLAVEDHASVLGRLPSCREYESYARETGAPSATMVRIRCGGWGQVTRALLERQEMAA